MDTQKFVANPVEVEAVQFVDTDSGMAIAQWIAEKYPNLPMPAQVNYSDDQPYSMMVQTNSGLVVAYLGDWVTLSEHGEFRPINPEIFGSDWSPAESDG